MLYIYIFFSQSISNIFDILDIYLNDAEIYFCGQKLYMSHIYFISMRGPTEFLPNLDRKDNHYATSTYRFVVPSDLLDIR